MEICILHDARVAKLLLIYRSFFLFINALSVKILITSKLV